MGFYYESSPLFQIKQLLYRDEYIAPIPESERHDLILAYHAQLTSVDDETRIKAAKAWTKWECVWACPPTSGSLLRSIL